MKNIYCKYLIKMNYNFLSVLTQTSQLDCKFAAPLIKDSIVDDTNSLTTLSFNYPNKLVWVASEKCFYYLRDDGNYDGSQISHWRKSGQSATITPYDSNKEYLTGECVYNGGKIYSAITNVPVNTSPPNQTYWLCIAGDITSQLININNVSSIEIDPMMDNPIIQVYDNNNTQVDCHIEKLSTQGIYGYNKFKLSFEINYTSTNFTGYVILK